MKKIFPLVVSIAIIMLAGTFASVGILAQFSDTEQIGVHDIQAGTLNLQVGDNDPSTVHITIQDIQPGFYVKKHYRIYNTGTLDGKLSVVFSSITNDDNGLTEPEQTDGDSTGGAGEGELGQCLIINGIFVEGCSSLRITPYKTKLNNVDGYTTGPVDLNVGTKNNLKLEFWLPIGTGNIVQSDSVEFDITFNLVQAP